MYISIIYKKKNNPTWKVKVKSVSFPIHKSSRLWGCGLDDSHVCKAPLSCGRHRHTTRAQAVPSTHLRCPPPWDWLPGTSHGGSAEEWSCSLQRDPAQTGTNRQAEGYSSSINFPHACVNRTILIWVWLIAVQVVGKKALIQHLVGTISRQRVTQPNPNLPIGILQFNTRMLIGQPIPRFL